MRNRRYDYVQVAVEVDAHIVTATASADASRRPNILWNFAGRFTPRRKSQPLLQADVRNALARLPARLRENVDDGLPHRQLPQGKVAQVTHRQRSWLWREYESVTGAGSCLTSLLTSGPVVDSSARLLSVGPEERRTSAFDGTGCASLWVESVCNRVTTRFATGLLTVKGGAS